MAHEPAASADLAHAGPPSLWREVSDFLHQFVIAAFDPYRPEQHYMRGPGPAWQARHGHEGPHAAADQDRLRS